MSETEYEAVEADTDGYEGIEYQPEAVADATPAEAAPEQEFAPEPTMYDEEALQQARAEAYHEALEAVGGGYEEQPQGYEEEGYEEEVANPLAEDPELAEYVENLVEQRFAERLGDFEPVLGMVAEREGAALAEGYLSNIEQQIGEFSHDHAHAIATGLANAGASPQEALYQAALMQREFEANLMTRAYQSYETQLSNGQSASAEPGVSGAANEVRELGDYDDIASSWIENGRRPSHAAG